MPLPRVVVVGDELAASGGSSPGWLSLLWQRYFSGKVDVAYRVSPGLRAQDGVQFVSESLESDPTLWNTARAVVVCLGTNDCALDVKDDNDDGDDDDDDVPPPLETAAAPTIPKCRTSLGDYEAALLALLQLLEKVVDGEVSKRCDGAIACQCLSVVASIDIFRML